jgi:hypothetical protein
VKFDDARPGKLDEIKPGDQLRARGSSTASGDELSAEEVVSGSFRNIAGTVASVNPGDKSIKVTDLISKQPVVVKMTADSQLRKLSPMIAQRIAQRLKAPADSDNAAGGQTPSASPAPARAGAVPDLQQVLQRLPSATLADLQKGDAVMIVATEGKEPGQATAISLLSGVEPILSASPNQEASTLLSPWNLGTSAGEAGTQ